MNSQNNFDNPFISHKGKKEKAPIISRIPFFHFESAEQLEQELLPNELCVASIENYRPTGFKRDYALVMKDEEGKVYSLQLMQHHGELKDTPENREILNGKGEASGPAADKEQTSEGGTKESAIPETEGSSEKSGV